MDKSMDCEREKQKNRQASKQTDGGTKFLCLL